MDTNDDLEDHEQAYRYEELVAAGMTPEGLGLMGDAEEEVKKAYAMVEQAKRTLREARDKQKIVKMSRQYYRTVRRERLSERRWKREPQQYMSSVWG